MFGQWITNVSINNLRNTDVTIGLIAKYCPRLESFAGFHRQQSCKEIKILAERVKRLHIGSRYDFTPHDLTGTIDRCPYLEVLSIYFITDKWSLPSTKIPKLHELRLLMTISLNPALVKGFLEQNGQLETLILEHVRFTYKFGVEHILDLLPHLRTLHINCTFESDFGANHFQCGDYDCFGRLRKLKNLRIAANTKSEPIILDAIVSHNVELERLACRINKPHEVNIIDLICRIKSLQYLELQLSHRDHFDLRRIVQVLPRLTELKVCYIDSARAMDLLRHAKIGLVNVRFVVTSDENENKEHRLEEIWTTAKQRGFILSVVLLYNEDNKELLVSFSILKSYASESVVRVKFFLENSNFVFFSLHRFPKHFDRRIAAGSRLNLDTRISMIRMVCHYELCLMRLGALFNTSTSFLSIIENRNISVQ